MLLGRLGLANQGHFGLILAPAGEQLKAGVLDENGAVAWPKKRQRTPFELHFGASCVDPSPSQHSGRQIACENWGMR